MGTVIDLGHFSPNITDAVRQLKQDMKDDWYPDSLAYEDCLKPEVAADILKASFEQNHGLFIPEGRTELNIPKKGFILRYSLEMSLPDRLYYQALVGHLIPFYDPLLPNQVLNHRHAVSEQRSGRYLFKHPVEQWKLFKGYVAEELHAKPVVLLTDIQNYYENIAIELPIQVLIENIPRIKADAAEKARIRRIIDELNRCLQKWCYRSTHGLPQNRDASSFLANLVMLNVDRAMLEKGYAYYRYMDDVHIATKSRYEARAALQFLATKLRQLGLSLNSAKTKIVEPDAPEYRDVLGQEEPVLTQIDSMWRSRSLPVIRRSFSPLRRLAEDLLKRGATQERGFRFCIQRFENLALCPELGVPKSYFDPLTDVCIHELDVQPYSSDQLVRFIKAAPTSDEQLTHVADLLCDQERSVYDWQNYLLWQLLVYKKYKDPRLINLARKSSQAIDRCADKAGATLYLGAMGTVDDRQFVVKSFPTFCQHLSQRNALIAIHEIDFYSGIQQNVKEHLLPSLVGAYKRLRTDFMGQYHRPLPTISAIELYDEMSAYD